MSEKLKIEFLRTDVWWIDFVIKIYNVHFYYSFSEVYSTQPEELILWLEKIYKQNYCELKFDVEDYYFYFDYDGKKFYLYDENNLLGEADDSVNHKYLHAVVEISRIELCKIFYKAFRDFVTSKKYRKIYWQTVSFEETLIDCYGSLDYALDFASSKTLAEFYDDYIQKTGYEKFLTSFELFDKFESADSSCYPIAVSYDFLTPEEKKDMIKKYCSDEVGGEGGKLSEVKSEILEQLLEE